MTKPWEKDKIAGESGDSGSVKPWEKDRSSSDLAAPPMEYAKGFAGGFNKGLTQMAGAPVDITNYVLSKVGLGSKEPVGGSKWIERQVRRVEPVTGNMYPTGPDTTGGRVIHRAGQEVGASAIPAGGMLKAAKGIPKVAPAGTQSVIREKILDPIGRSPGKASAGELASATSAGLAAGAANEVAPGNTLAETSAQLIGGVAPTVAGFTPTGIAVRAYRAVTSRFSDTSQKAAARAAVNKALGGAMSDAAKKKIAKANEIASKAPGFDPSLGEATGSQPLIAQQVKVEAEATGQFLDEVVDRRVRNLQAIENYSNAAAPKGDVSPSIVIDSATRRMEKAGDTIDRLTLKNQMKQKDLKDAIPQIDRVETGKSIRKGIYAAKGDASAKMSLRAQELGLNNADLSQEFGAWKEMLREKYKPSSRFSNSRNQPQILKEILADDIPETFFTDIKAIRERTVDELVRSSTGKVDRQKVRTLIRLQKDVDALLKSFDEKLGEKYAQFRGEYYNNYIKVFEDGAIFKSRDKNGNKFHKILDEKVAGLFLDNQAAAKQYMDVFGNDPEMMKHLQAAILDDLSESATVDGMLDSAKLKSWSNRNKRVLGELPQIKKAVGDIEATQSALFDRQLQLANRRKELENIALSKRLTSYSKLRTGADNIISEAVTDSRKMVQLVSSVRKDPDALSALQRNVWEKIVSGSSKEILESISKNRKSLNILYGPKHLEDMELVSAMKLMMERVPPPKGAPVESTPLKKIEDLTGMPIPQFGTRGWAYITGRVPKYYLTFDIARQAIYKKAQRHFDAVLKEALYDREVAREVAESVVAIDMPTKKATRLGARLFALGLPHVEEMNERDN